MPTATPKKKRVTKPRVTAVGTAAPKSKPKRKRKRKSHYITGVHVSPKSVGLIKYRSGWELSTLQFLDNDPNVKSYLYESFKIPYLANAKTGKIRQYIPDFLVIYADGTKKVVEVKRKDKLTQPKTLKKLIAGKAWCQKNNLIFEVWTDDVIKQIRSIPKVINESTS